MSTQTWQPLIEAALAEDLGGVGDLTSKYFVSEESTSRVRMVAREACALSGIELAADVFTTVDASLNIKITLGSGQQIYDSGINRAAILEVSGNTRSILTAERTALNFAQRLTGIATLTAAFVNEVQGTNAIILDTRKTTPGWRALEKAAVVHGGGQNHRMGLYDRVMIKDNHLAAEDALTEIQASIDALHKDHPGVEVEVEADTLDQVRGFLTLKGVDYILLDNMTNGQRREAVALAKDTSVKLEASGGIVLETAHAAAETGVDFISIGAITHSSRSIDLALDAI
ncbi:MAG: carboxylating nicotinate-nucleotide diphosphorylase, partial [Verrucomicrobiaceae bacterium]|nr:carboxylating nicotinate-nucleotide diphosphorylase [Verrucomicrobiaceae bacterium]